MDDLTRRYTESAVDYKVPIRGYSILGMLFVFQTLNFFDKLAFGVSALPLMREFGLSPKQFGLIGAYFFLFFAVGGAAIGLAFVGRFRIKTIILVLAAIWTFSQLVTFFAASIQLIIFCRLLLGIGEGAALATCMTAAYEWFPVDKRNLPSAVVLQGISAGFLIGGPLLTYLMIHFGWRTSFLVCGILSLVWLLGWLVIGKQGPLSEPKHQLDLSGSRLPTRVLWLDRTVVGVMLVAFFSYWVVGMSAVWLPSFLRVGLGYRAVTSGWIISAIYILQSPLLLFGGWLTQRMRTTGWNARACLGYSTAAALLISGVAMLAAVNSPTGVLQICFLSLAFSAPSLTTIFCPVVLAMVAPAAQRSRLIVVIMSGASISAFFSTYGNGWIISRFSTSPHAGYATAFGVAGIALLIGALLAALMLSPDRSIARFKSRLLTE